MPKASQTPSKAKSSTKVEAKPKILKPKLKKNDKPLREPTPTPAPSPSISTTIPTSSSPIPTAALVPIIPISIVPPPSKSTTHAPEPPTKGTSKPAKVKATSRKSVKKIPEDATQSDTGVKEFEDDECGKVEEDVTSHEEHDAQNIANKAEKSENEGVSGDEKESDTEVKTETRPQEPGSLLTPFSGDEEVSSDEDDMALFEVGKKSRKATVKATKVVASTRKGVAPPARNPLTRSKRKLVDAQIMKESRSTKKPKKKVSIIEPIFELEGEEESDSALPAESATP
ncbi:PREDICTED: putative uncharacterized protein DDB_G0290521 [Nicotiana attenuata]|uniref:putative uncharacterized protein DDB_G0290521 n=1 Tax=Nicotiana attenuata TaxID=49451 RepID=UPI000904FBFA|nr:PREDICTED: putative uncharacterized protein DDB_G0290521 [Nicotiana attenuata]